MTDLLAILVLAGWAELAAGCVATIVVEDDRFDLVIGAMLWAGALTLAGSTVVAFWVVVSS